MVYFSIWRSISKKNIHLSDMVSKITPEILPGISAADWQIVLAAAVLIVSIAGVKLREIHRERRDLNEKIYDPLYKELVSVADYDYSISDIYGESFPFDTTKNKLVSDWEDIKYHAEVNNLNKETKMMLEEYSNYLTKINNLEYDRKNIVNDIFSGAGDQGEIKEWYAYSKCALIINGEEDSGELRQKMIEFAELSGNSILNDVHEWWMNDPEFQDDIIYKMEQSRKASNPPIDPRKIRFWKLHHKQQEEFENAKNLAQKIATKIQSERKRPPLRFHSYTRLRAKLVDVL